MSNKKKLSPKNQTFSGLDLAQNNDQYGGYTVLTLSFSGELIQFLTLKDAQAICEKLVKELTDYTFRPGAKTRWEFKQIAKKILNGD